MKKSILSLFVLATLTLTVACKNDKAKEAETSEASETQASSEAAAKFTVNTAESVIDWTGSKLNGKHTGTLRLSKGDVSVNNGVLETGNFTIDMNSITDTDLTGDDKTALENHLKGNVEGKEDHFFDVKKFPEGKFELTKVTAEAGKSTLEGNLTLKGVTKNVKFPATVTIDGNNVSIVSETFTINRTLWNVNFGSKSIFDDLGNKYINDEIELKISIKASK
ncbi:YceI family protein [Flavobacterium sp. '19STA2R22 D10 B1']|uniref:YceI family protein n=1 Tax=Flavobacterium aerium TaxID=3037261 RepID=UPI00278BDFA6|nr:YceI family protein [Flavobacterium sp. '19STA2R22 D10 B1']